MPRTPFEVAALVARGAGAHLTVTSYAEYFRHPNIVHIPVSGLPPATTSLVWRSNSSDPHVDELARVAREVTPALEGCKE